MTLSVLFVGIVTMLMQNLLIIMFFVVVTLNVDAHEVFDCFLCSTAAPL